MSGGREGLRLRRLARRLGLRSGGGWEEEGMSEEMRFHLEMEAEDLMAAGHSPAEARRLARVRFGGVERYKEEARAGRTGQVAEEVARDVRVALRGMRRRPAFAAAVVATLAVGIGATTAVWSVVDAALLRALPYADAGELVRLHASWEGEPTAAISPAEYVDFRRDAAGAFEALGAYARGAVTAGSAGAGAERVDAAFVSAELFGVLGAQPVAGRTFTTEEELGGESVLVLSEGFWRSRFGAEPGIVGEAMTVEGAPFTVVGVLPASARLPEDLVEGSRPSLLLPLGIHPDSAYRRGSHFLQAAGRLRSGTTVADAAEAVELVAARFMADYPDDYPPESRFRFTAIPLREAVSGDVRPALVAALGAVVLVLLVGAANVAALLLARGEARRGEVALRAVLGARRGRLVRQLVVEVLLLALVGGLVGVGLAWAGVQGLVGLAPPGIPRLDEVGVDARVLAFAGALSLGCGLLFGLIPALRVTPEATAGALRESATRSPGRRSQRLRKALVVAEVALALALVTGAGLLGRSLARLLEVDTGLAIEHVVATRFSVPATEYPEPEDVRGLVAEASARVAALPGVEAAGAVTNLPLSSGIGDLGVVIPGKEMPPGGNLDADWQAATPGYARAAGLRLVAGRWIDATDRAEGAGAVVINRTFAESWWPDGDALGATIRLTADAAPAEARVVGIVEDVRHEGPATAAKLQIYLPHRQFRFWFGGGAARTMTMVARTQGGAAMAPAIRSAFAGLDPGIGLGPLLTLEDAYRDVLSWPRLLAVLVGAFAAIALLLAAIGVYGVMAYSVGRRRREFGIRAAMGARARTIAREVVVEGLGLVGIGLAVGAVGALLLSRSLRSLLFGVSATDPWSLAVGAGVLLAAALLATWLPARSALRTDPAVTLRAE